MNCDVFHDHMIPNKGLLVSSIYQKMLAYIPFEVFYQLCNGKLWERIDLLKYFQHSTRRNWSRCSLEDTLDSVGHPRFRWKYGYVKKIAYFECFLPPQRCSLAYWNSSFDKTLEHKKIWARSIPNQSAAKKGYCFIFVMWPSMIRLYGWPVKLEKFWCWIILATFFRLVFSALYSTAPFSPLELFQM